MTQPQKPRLLEQVRNAIRRRNYSYRTEETYIDWIKRFIFFHQKRHPKEMGRPEIEAFLTHLAVEGMDLAIYLSKCNHFHRSS